MKIINYGMVSHISFDRYHTSVYSGTIVCPGHVLDGKIFMKATDVYKPFGSGRVIERYGISTATQAEKFSTFKAFREFHNLPELTKE